MIRREQRGFEMKKIIAMLLLCALLLGFTGCGGDVSDVQVQLWKESELYDDKEIHSAINETIRYFKKHFNGCTLTEITYAGDESTAAHAEWAERHDADEAIVLISSFDVDSSGGDGSLNPNSTYKGWNWILVRDTGGRWRHVDHGY